MAIDLFVYVPSLQPTFLHTMDSKWVTGKLKEKQVKCRVSIVAIKVTSESGHIPSSKVSRKYLREQENVTREEYELWKKQRAH